MAQLFSLVRESYLRFPTGQTTRLDDTRARIILMVEYAPAIPTMATPNVLLERSDGEKNNDMISVEQ